MTRVPLVARSEVEVVTKVKECSYCITYTSKWIQVGTTAFLSTYTQFKTLLGRTAF